MSTNVHRMSAPSPPQSRAQIHPAFDGDSSSLAKSLTLFNSPAIEPLRSSTSTKSISVWHSGASGGDIGGEGDAGGGTSSGGGPASQAALTAGAQKLVQENNVLVVELPDLDRDLGE